MSARDSEHSSAELSEITETQEETQETQEITEIEINTEDKNMIETTIGAETTEEAVMTTEEKEMREERGRGKVS